MSPLAHRYGLLVERIMLAGFQIIWNPANVILSTVFLNVLGKQSSHFDQRWPASPILLACKRWCRDILHNNLGLKLM